MSETAETADPAVCCSLLHSGSGIEQSQSLAPDLFRSRAPARARPRERGPHARDSRGRFAKGHSGNPRGRPRGIPNPQRRVLTLAAWRHNPQAAAALLNRKPRLLRPVLVQLLPRRARPQDPAERLGISVEALHSAADMQQAMQQVCSAVAAGEIGIREAGHIARQVRTRMRALRRFARLHRRLARLANKTDPAGRRPHPNPPPQAGEGVRGAAEDGWGLSNKTDPAGRRSAKMTGNDLYEQGRSR